ncbi:thioesterase II family protein [Pseudidiomarina aestuarii]|uniref:thioesterase II family protein n=1 Tax=Pseudidiomarina aestuarii TaxID=624146 RepID=UPI003A9868C6
MTLQDSNLFFVPQRRLAPKVRLFYFPFAGGSAQSYQQWHYSSNSDVEQVFVQLKGRGSRICEQPHQTMQQLIEELMTHATYFTEYPFMIFGHSLGALISYALCCQLQKSNLPMPVHLFVSACRAPHLPFRNQIRHVLPHGEFIQALEQLNGTPVEVLRNEELMALFEPMLRADFRIAETYQAEPVPMPFSVSVIYGEQDTSIDMSQLTAWSALTENTCAMRSYPGEHFYINQNSTQLADYIQSVIGQCLNDKAVGV